MTTTDLEIKCKSCETNVVESSDVPEWSDEWIATFSNYVEAAGSVADNVHGGHIDVKT